MPPGKTPVPAAPTSTALPSATATTLAWSVPQGWHLLYRRPEFMDLESTDLRAVGDIMLARGVEPRVRRQQPGWLFEPTTRLLDGEVVAGNLESPFAAMRRPEALRPGPYRLAADPGLIDRLGPFTALSLANNHALDAGPEGLADAEVVLRMAGIRPLGIGHGSCSENPVPTVEPARSTEPLELLAYNAVSDPQDLADEAETCGRAWLDDAALEEVAALRKATSRPIVVFVHWGREYASEPDAEQQMWARRLVGAGADLIVGSHPHVVQPAELLEVDGRRGFVAYSLGNFVFDQLDQKATSQSLVLRVWLDHDGVGAVAVAPVGMVDGRPVPLALDSPDALAQLAAIEPLPGTVSAPGAPQPPAGPQAWHWDGTTFTSMAAPQDAVAPETVTSLDVDLRGDGEPLRATLDQGVVRIWDGEQVVWQNEEPAWHVAGMTSGDVDNDGRFELLIWLWKPDANGVLRSQPFLVGWRGGRYRVFWGGSPVGAPIHQAAIGTVDDQRNVLVVLDQTPELGAPAQYVTVWTWQGWNFERLWRSAPGSYTGLLLRDLDGDGIQEIIAW